MVWLAFAAIYVIWGSTYLAIRILVESMPAFFAAGLRFLIAGVLLFVVMRLKGVRLPSAEEWRHSVVTGTLLLVGGNGLVVWAERSVSSGRAALIVAMAPVWFATLEWLRPGGKRPDLKTMAGIIVGFAGVIILVNGRGANGGESSFWGVLALLVAGISWAAGSLFGKYRHNSASPWMNAASQMIAGGAGLLLLGTMLGEPFRTDWSEVTMRSVGALIYLIVAGSWVGFSAYVWLLKVSVPSKISTYAYVNPVIAVFLGWLALDEAVTWRMLWGALVVLAGVIVITIPMDAIKASFRRSLPAEGCGLLRGARE